MPIYEFKCSECQELFEMLFMTNEEQVEAKCPKCGSEIFERVMSAASYAMGSGSGSAAGTQSNTRTCPSGSCTTWDLPGPS